MFAQGDYGLHPTINVAQLARTATASLRDHLARRHDRGRVIRELNTYTDRELADIGLSRPDIADVAAGRYAR